MLGRSENSPAFPQTQGAQTDAYFLLRKKKIDPAIKIYAFYLIKCIFFVILKGTFLYITLDFSACLFPSLYRKLAFFFYSPFCIIVKNISLKAKMLLDMKQRNVSISVPVKQSRATKASAATLIFCVCAKKLNLTCGSGFVFLSRENGKITTHSDFGKKEKKKKR